MNRQRSKRQPRRGILLLLVLSMLAFMSILVVTYVAFSSRTRRNAYALASREFRSIKHDEVIDDALLTLLRGPRSTTSGTYNTTNPFFGEDLLADIYGVTDHTTTAAIGTGNMRDINGDLTSLRRPMYLGNQFVRIPLDIASLVTPRTDGDTSANGNPLYHLDDALAGRIVTIGQGPLANQSFRILRSTGNRDASASEEEFLTKHSVVIELDPNVIVTLGSGERTSIGALMSTSRPFAIATLFYAPGAQGAWGAPGQDDDGANGTDDFSEAGYPNTDDSPYPMLINGTVMNGGGVGYEGPSGVSDTTSQSLPLPQAFQPNVRHSSGEDKSNYAGDADEPYDAADFQNWFLAQRYVDENGVTQVIPSFHRPALINYLVNEFDLSSVSAAELRSLVAAIRRATLRPLPFASGANGQLPPSPSLPHSGFTGGNTNFVLRSPNRINDPDSVPQMRRLDALVSALVNGPWDVDNDGDSIPDSVWVDLGLPPVSSPEGKILRPLIAPLIEDMGGRLNLNAHGNVAQLEPQPGATAHPQYGVNQSGPWGGTTTNQARQTFRGLGYGPAEIALPGEPFRGDGSGVGAAGTMNADSQLFTTAERLELLRQRYRDPSELSTNFPNTPAPGRNDGDDLDILLHGVRPGTHTLGGGWGMSIDPWGRGGLGLHRTGQLFASVSGTVLEPFNSNANPTQPLLNESFNDPYEMDPTGRLGGDSPYTLAELEVLIRNNPWVADELPERLRKLVTNSASANPEFANMVTTRSVSLDLPTAMMTIDHRQNRSFPLAGVLLARLGVDVTPPTLPQNPSQADRTAFNTALVAYRDEITAANARYRTLIAPELRLGNKMDINRPFGNGVDDNNNGTIDEPEEVRPVDMNAQPTDNSAFPSASATSSHVESAFANRTPNYRADQGNDPNDPGGRQLFARNLYILMMALTGEGYDFPLASNDGGNLIDPDLYKARRLAQWAVNVADYRDHDSIMTAFEYDADLSDGTWDVDGDLTTDEGSHRDVVWGVENPELVFSESMAFHDVRVRDTEYEQAGGGGEKKDDTNNPDEDTDSIRMPQGSLFMELYCPRARVDGDANHLAGVPRELYNVDNNGDPHLQLDRLAPAPTGGGPRMPVWRIAISEPHYEQVATEKSVWDPETLRNDLPDTASFEPTAPDELQTEPPNAPAGGLPDTLEMQRFVFFNALGAGPSPTAAQIAATVPDVQPYEVFSSVANPLDPPFSAGVDRTLEPSQYLMLAPRVTTHMGSFVYTTPDEPTGPSEQRFQVFTNANPWTGGGNRVEGLLHVDRMTNITTRNTNAQSRPALPLIIGTARPNGWAATSLESGYVGLNVSEPLPRGTVGYYIEPTQHLDSSNTDDFPLTDAYLDYDTLNGVARDQPEDMRLDGPIRRLTDDLLPGNDDPFLGTVPQYCSAFLQRLADPTRPFNAVTNPYRTVDWMTIDLTVFSGEEEPTKVETNASEYAAQSRQRNGQTRIPGQAGVLFSYQTEPLANPVNMPPAVANTESYFAFDVQNTLNYLNDGFGPPIIGANNEDRGQPQTPFAMHHWLNRPFATAYELMMVPATSQGRLFEEFTLADTSESPYEPAANDADFARFRAPFGHLLNFFQTSEAEDESAHFYRLFEYAGTKPPFRGEVELIRPSRTDAVGSAPFSPWEYSRNAFVSLFQPPFNQRWDGRREGAINLNTLAGYPVWMGLMYGHLTSAERDSAPDGFTGDLNYGTFMAARRGYIPEPSFSPIVDGNGNVRPRPYNFGANRFSPDSPTEFAGAWRTGLDADLAPDVHGANGAPTDALQRPGIEATLSRPDIDPASFAEQNNPAFVRPTSGDAAKDTQRSAAMRYQTLMRMPNLTTNQSHIFLVRLTVGYFEFDETNGLGPEYKADLGQHQRYKATFIIDRSIPVGYEPGSDTNVRDTILFSRIEE